MRHSLSSMSKTAPPSLYFFFLLYFFSEHLHHILCLFVYFLTIYIFQYRYCQSFHKEPDSKYSKTYRLYDLDSNYSTLPLWHINSDKQCMNKWTYWCSSKSSFVKKKKRLWVKFVNPCSTGNLHDVSNTVYLAHSWISRVWHIVGTW